MTDNNSKSGNSMWGGRFETAPSNLMLQLTASIPYDRRLYRHDIMGSKAHAAMLARQGIISAQDGKAIDEGLSQVQAEIDAGNFNFKLELEDIHMNIEARLAELIGPAAGRMHTARSRNDQVATAHRLWLRDAVDSLMADLSALLATLEAKAKAHENTILPGCTHTQIAQPVTLGLHLMAYHAMFARDMERLEAAKAHINLSPLGSAALAGTSFPIDRDMTAKALGFAKPIANTMDAVGSRDFVLEYLSAINISGVHLSRLAHELVQWSTSQYGYVRLSDAYTTGSSIMPQKKNPDAAELIRARSGKLAGNLMQMTMVVKALPLTYNLDFQEDKLASFEAYDTLALSLKVMAAMIGEMTVNEARMRDDAENGFSTATDLADWLVKNLNLPFRQAHHVTGKIVKMAEQKNCRLSDLALQDMQGVEAGITADIYNALSVEQAVSARLKR